MELWREGGRVLAGNKKEFPLFFSIYEKPFLRPFILLGVPEGGLGAQ
jgi:hypothetical protein